MKRVKYQLGGIEKKALTDIRSLADSLKRSIRLSIKKGLPIRKAVLLAWNSNKVNEKLQKAISLHMVKAAEKVGT